MLICFCRLSCFVINRLFQVGVQYVLRKNVGTMTRQLDLSSQAAWLVDTETTLITIKTAQPKQITTPAVAGLNVVL